MKNMKFGWKIEDRAKNGVIYIGKSAFFMRISKINPRRQMDYEHVVDYIPQGLNEKFYYFQLQCLCRQTRDV